MTYASKLLFFFDQVQSNFAKNNFDEGVIITYIIKFKISKFLLKAILLNYLNNLFHNNLIKIRANNLTQANKHYLKLHVVINIISYNSNKSDKVAQDLNIKQKINTTLSLTYFFRQSDFLFVESFYYLTIKKIIITWKQNDKSR